MTNQRNLYFYYIFIGILGLVPGCLCLFNPSGMLEITFVFLGFLLILQAIPALMTSITNGFRTNDDIAVGSMSIILIALGLAMMFYHGMVLAIIAGVFLLVFPIYRIIKSKNKKQQLKTEAFRIALGVVIIVFGAGSVLEILVRILGGLLVAFCLYIIVLAVLNLIKMNKKERKDKRDSEVIDV